MDGWMDRKKMKKKDGWLDGYKKIYEKMDTKIYEKWMVGWIKNIWMVGWIKKRKKKMDGWMDRKK